MMPLLFMGQNPPKVSSSRRRVVPRKRGEAQTLYLADADQRLVGDTSRCHWSRQTRAYWRIETLFTFYDMYDKQNSEQSRQVKRLIQGEFSKLIFISLSIHYRMLYTSQPHWSPFGIKPAASFLTLVEYLFG